MHNTLAIIGGFVAISSSIPYIVNTLRGRTHPNLVSWFTWMLLHVVAVGVAFASGSIQTAIAGIISWHSQTNRYLHWASSWRLT
jgi:hypothetical protein